MQQDTPWTLNKCQTQVDQETKIQYWSDSKMWASELRVCKLQVCELWVYEFASRKSSSSELINFRLQVHQFTSCDLQLDQDVIRELWVNQ